LCAAGACLVILANLAALTALVWQKRDVDRARQQLLAGPPAQEDVTGPWDPPKWLVDAARNYARNMERFRLIGSAPGASTIRHNEDLQAAVRGEPKWRGRVRNLNSIEERLMDGMVAMYGPRIELAWRKTWGDTALEAVPKPVPLDMVGPWVARTCRAIATLGLLALLLGVAILLSNWLRGNRDVPGGLAAVREQMQNSTTPGGQAAAAE
jgi:hypothetical protein